MDSQGFCCNCQFKSFLGLGDDIKRGSLCEALNFGSGASTAHCLKYDSLWYSAYNIKSHYIYYEIKVQIEEID